MYILDHFFGATEGKSGIGEENVANSSNPADIALRKESETATSPFSLAPTRWLISMDIGREKGTWIPQSWGISGRWEYARSGVKMMVCKFVPSTCNPTRSTGVVFQLVALSLTLWRKYISASLNPRSLHFGLVVGRSDSMKLCFGFCCATHTQETGGGSLRPILTRRRDGG